MRRRCTRGSGIWPSSASSPGRNGGKQCRMTRPNALGTISLTVRIAQSRRPADISATSHATARSMHKSQGFGVSPNRGSQLNFFDFIAGELADTSLFEGIDISWNRVEGGREIEKAVENIIEIFN